jgi:DNA replicative helicase MCM subunit Mcm2 (Cdc46/Mcm family)
MIRYGSLSKFLSTERMSKYKFYRLLRKGVIRLYDLKHLVKTLNIDYNSLDTYVSEVGYRGFKGMYWVKLPVVNKDFIKFLANLYTRSSVITNRWFEPIALRYRINSDEDVEYLISNLRRFFLQSNSSLSYRVCRGEMGRYVVIKNKLLSLLISSWGISNIINKLTSRLISSLSKDYLVLLIRELVKNSGFVGEGYIRISLTTKTSAILLNMMLRRFGILSSIDELGSEYRLVINDLKSFKIFLREVLGCEEYSKDDTLTNDGNYLEINDELSAVMVTDVIEGPGQAVYDLTIDGTHSFIANGFIVHNTAAVIKEKQSGEYFLEAGAMVLADGGIVCIDEIDKMRDEDRVAIHEAMEQGTVSIAKAGIVARLNARASVLAAGNPKYGRYIPSRPIAENINLPITILSRFDLIFTLRDLTDVERDKSLVRHVLRTHEAIEEVRPEIPPDILRKYVAYARKYVKPRLTRDAELLIEEFYLEMRRKSAEVPEAPIAITTRQLEALIRLAEAHARMALKNHVDVEDAAEAIRLMNVMLENVGIDVETGQIDIDVIMTGKPKSIRDKELIIKDIIRELSSEEGCAKIKDIVREAVKKGIDEDFVEKYITSLRRVGELYEVRTGCVNFVE